MKTIISRSFVTLAVLALLVPASLAQGRARGRHYNKTEVERIIKRVETRSDEFKDAVDKNLDRSRLDGTRREDNINEQVKQLERALDNLRGDFDKTDRWIAVRNDVAAVLRQADEVGRIVKNNRFNSRVEGGWLALRRDLNTLAGVYELPRLKY